MAAEGDRSSSSRQVTNGPGLPWYRSLPYLTSGDIDAFCSLFSQNLANSLAGCAMVLPALGREIVYGRIVPGMGFACAFGCIFYVIQALLQAAKTGKRHTAQPFGINSPGIFAFNAIIILPVYYAKGGGAEAADLAWQMGCLANFIQGLVELALIPIGPQISRSVPLVALLGTLASVGLAFLFTEPLAVITDAPLTGFVAWTVLLLSMYAGVRVPYVPKNILPVAAGVAMAWITGLATRQQVSQSLDIIGCHPPVLSVAYLQHFQQGMQYIGVILPIAFTVVFETIQCRELAAQVGDDYSVRWSMFGDGFTTVLSALLGCPYGVTIFIGHSAFKEMGACIGYNLLSALAFVIVFCTGFAALLLAAIPVPVLEPMVMFVGISICAEALEVTPPRHWPAFVVALVPALCNWTFIQAQNFAAAICKAQAGGACAVDPRSIEGWLASPALHGLELMSQGFLLTSMFYASILAFVIDRRLLACAATSFAAALCASCGLIHSSEVFLPWRGQPGVSRQFDMHLELAGAYALTCGIFIVAHMTTPFQCKEAGLNESVESKESEDGSVTVSTGVSNNMLPVYNV